MKTKTATKDPFAIHDAPTGNADAKAALEKMIAKALPKVSDFKTRREKLHYVADMIEAEALVKKGVGFNMGDFCGQADDETQDQTGNYCETVACIAGWTTLLEDGIPEDFYRTNFHARARDVLGIEEEEAMELFYGGSIVHLEHVTPAHAVAVIRHLADNGTVRWNLFDDDGKKKAPSPP